MVKIGILNLQGAVLEHYDLTKIAIEIKIAALFSTNERLISSNIISMF